MLKQNYEISDHFEVHRTNYPNGPPYSRINPFVIRNYGPCDSQVEDPHNQAFKAKFMGVTT